MCHANEHVFIDDSYSLCVSRSSVKNILREVLATTCSGAAYEEQLRQVASATSSKGVDSEQVKALQAKELGSFVDTLTSEKLLTFCDRMTDDAVLAFHAHMQPKQRNVWQHLWAHLDEDSLVAAVRKVMKKVCQDVPRKRNDEVRSTAEEIRTTVYGHFKPTYNITNIYNDK